YRGGARRGAVRPAAPVRRAGAPAFLAAQLAGRASAAVGGAHRADVRARVCDHEILVNTCPLSCSKDRRVGRVFETHRDCWSLWWVSKTRPTLRKKSWTSPRRDRAWLPRTRAAPHCKPARRGPPVFRSTTSRSSTVWKKPRSA